jgi:uncharacterized protein YjbI with pentapeptide repeats
MGDETKIELITVIDSRIIKLDGKKLGSNVQHVVNLLDALDGYSNTKLICSLKSYFDIARKINTNKSDLNILNGTILNLLAKKEATIKDLNLIGVSLSSTHLIDIDFNGCNLNGIDFSHSTIDNCNFSGAFIDNANFSEVVFRDDELDIKKGAKDFITSSYKGSPLLNRDLHDLGKALDLHDEEKALEILSNIEARSK